MRFLYISSLKASIHSDRHCQVDIATYEHMILIEHAHCLENLYRILLNCSPGTVFAFQYFITHQINHSQQLEALNCTVKWILKYGNFLCTCFDVQKKKISRTWKNISLANVQGNGGLTSCFNFWQHKEQIKQLDSTCDANHVSC